MILEFTALINKMLIFVALMIIGYGLAKHGICGPDFTKTASWVVLNVFMVGTILSSMITTGAERDLADIAEIILLTFVMTAIGYLVAAVLIRFFHFDDEHASIFEILMATGNSMFIALPIAESIYGAYAVFIVSVSCIPFNIFLYSYGAWRINGGGAGSAFRLRNIFSVPLIATLSGLLIILLGIPVPAALRSLFSSLSGATMPMSMMIIGTSLGSVSLLDAFRKRKFALLSAIRLILIPVITWLICRLLTDDTVLLMTCMIISAAPSAVIISVLAIQYGRDGVFSSEGVQHSTVCSMVTIPLLIHLFSRLS